jgi:hypothetical protein
MSDLADIRDINEGKVDSRLATTRITHPTLPLERTFCSFCGKPKGWVSQDSGDFIAAENVVVVCDACNEKFEAKLGKIPGEEAPVQEYNLRDAELGFDENLTSDWVDNCIDCRIPMVKLTPQNPAKFAPIMESLRTGDCFVDSKRALRIKEIATTAIPTWYCRKCRTLWGYIEMFWCKFKKI